MLREKNIEGRIIYIYIYIWRDKLNKVQGRKLKKRKKIYSGGISWTKSRGKNSIKKRGERKEVRRRNSHNPKHRWQKIT